MKPRESSYFSGQVSYNNKKVNYFQMKRARQIKSETQGDVYVRVPSDIEIKIINR